MLKGRIVNIGPTSWRPVFEEPFECIGEFLTTEVCYNIEFCDRVFLKTAIAIASRKSEPGGISSCYCTAHMTPTWVLIGFRYKPEMKPTMISMQAYQSVLEYWISILKMWDEVTLTPPVDPPEFSFDDPSVLGMTSEMRQAEIEKMRKDWGKYQKRAD